MTKADEEKPITCVNCGASRVAGEPCALCGYPRNYERTCDEKVWLTGDVEDKPKKKRTKP